VSRILKSLALGILFVSAGAWAIEIPPSALDNYRLESQYGPNDALLSPIYDRNHRLEIAAGVATSPLSSLGNYQGLTGSIFYNINRRHGIEPLFYSYQFPGLSSFVKKQIAEKTKPSGATNDDLSVEVPRQIFLASYFFTPYHSKLHLTAHSVMHFDIYFGAGAGVIQTVPITLNEDQGKSSWGALVSANAGMRFLFGGDYFTRLDFKNLIYSSEDFGKSSRKNDLQLGLSIGLLL
jgi:outer membrane beta-barrel protein